MERTYSGKGGGRLTDEDLQDISLAINLGFVSRRRMLKELSHVEYMEAKQLMARRPWGALRDAIHLGILVRNLTALKGIKPAAISTYVYEWQTGTSEVVTAEDLEAVADLEPIKLVE